MFLVQVNDNDGILTELVHIGIDREVAETKFLDTCIALLHDAEGLHDAEYSEDEKNAILDNGYEKVGAGVAMLIDTSNCTTDDKLRDALTGQPAEDMTVAEIVEDGEVALEEGMSVDKILELCGENLDACCSWDIQGQILFKGSDGKWYTITTESTIDLAAPEFVSEVLAENQNA